MYPERLDHILYVHLLDCEVREEILNTRTRPMTVGPEVDVRVISVSSLVIFDKYPTLLVKTEGCPGAKITALYQKATICKSSALCQKNYSHSLFLLRSDLKI